MAFLQRLIYFLFQIAGTFICLFLLNFLSNDKSKNPKRLILILWTSSLADTNQ